jgi:NADP-dependent 3-hydroxy acid dehydrogenase YdfG
VVIDADIDGPDKDLSEVACNPDDVAEAVYWLHRQPKAAWTSEIDIRPANERFWEHC